MQLAIARCKATLVNDALTMAANSRETSSNTILHSDQGSQITSWSFSQNLKHHELLGSMGTVGDCFDNAPMESFWGTMQIELLNRKTWMTYVELATAMADYIVNFSSLGYLTPDEFEALPSPNNPARTLIAMGQSTGPRSGGSAGGGQVRFAAQTLFPLQAPRRWCLVHPGIARVFQNEAK